MIEGFFRSVMSTFFPSPCVACGYLGEVLCVRCFDSLPFQPHVRIIEGEGALRVLRIASAYFYKKDSLLSQLIHPFKYQHQADLFRLFVPGMRESLRLLTAEWTSVVLVPIPLHESRLKERGYNQAELLAQAMGRQLGVPVWKGLERIRDTGYQSHLVGRAGRKENMEGVFRAVAAVPKDRQMLLVDDIVTTGSTLVQAVRALQAAGAETVSALTLADRDDTAYYPWN